LALLVSSHIAASAAVQRSKSYESKNVEAKEAKTLLHITADEFLMPLFCGAL
jgi:hypothetical protein